MFIATVLLPLAHIVTYWKCESACSLLRGRGEWSLKTRFVVSTSREVPVTSEYVDAFIICLQAKLFYRYVHTAKLQVRFSNMKPQRIQTHCLSTSLENVLLNGTAWHYWPEVWTLKYEVRILNELTRLQGLPDQSLGMFQECSDIMKSWPVEEWKKGDGLNEKCIKTECLMHSTICPKQTIKKQVRSW